MYEDLKEYHKRGVKVGENWGLQKFCRTRKPENYLVFFFLLRTFAICIPIR